jgi:hypothetical protein
LRLYPGSRMTSLEQIDQLLADWKQKVSVVSQNLIELQELPTYQRLASHLPEQLTGITAAQVTPALEAIHDLFQQFDALLKPIDQAMNLRKQVSRFLGSEKTLQEIEHLLTGASIQWAIAKTPFLQRDLLTAAETETTIAPAQLLSVMTHTYQIARDVVLAVDAAWLQLASNLANAEAEMRSLQQSATLIGQNSLQELIQAQRTIENLRDRLESDPLGVQAEFEQTIQPLIERARKAVQQGVQQQIQVQERFAIAHHLLAQLEQIHHQATAAYRESQEKVLDHSRLQAPISPDHIIALSQWLTRLEAKFAEGLINPVLIGLENWMLKTNEYFISQKRAYSANIAPLETRRELRGRLDALKAKALARKQSEDAILVDLATQAKQLLYTRPTPLEDAAKLVSQYEKRLNSS